MGAVKLRDAPACPSDVDTSTAVLTETRRGVGK